jgi:hypothetical protein
MTQRLKPPPGAVGQLALTGAQPLAPYASAVAVQSSGSNRDLTTQPPQQDLDAALVQLTTAVSTSGRERAAHTLLDAHVQASRERAWRERDTHRAPRPVPGEHRRHLSDLERAQVDLGHARDVAQRLASQLRDLEHTRDSLPIWARGRRRDLTNRIETTRTGWFHDANDQVDRAVRVVESATKTVDADSVQRVADERADRNHRHQLWLEQPQRPYIYPSLDITNIETPEQPSPVHRLIHDPHRVAQPPSQGYGRSL